MVADELFRLRTLEAELEMCFVKKVKNYCDTEVTQRDEAGTRSLAVDPQLRKSNEHGVVTAHHHEQMTMIYSLSPFML